MLTEQELAALRRKYFPRVPWTDNGPVRRVYLAKNADGGDVVRSLIALAAREQFIADGQTVVTGDAVTCLEALRKKADDPAIGMIFGTETAAFWSDISLSAEVSDGWRLMTVRSEEGENLVALAHDLGILRFRRAPQQRS